MIRIVYFVLAMSHCLFILYCRKAMHCCISFDITLSSPILIMLNKHFDRHVIKAMHYVSLSGVNAL